MSCVKIMAHITAYFAARDYTKPAIDRRIAELLKRRVGLEELPTESLKERLVCKAYKLLQIVNFTRKYKYYLVDYFI